MLKYYVQKIGMSQMIYCGDCGTANPLSNKYCGSCGLELVKLSKERESQLEYPEFSSNVCPQCQKFDLIQKVSAIVANATQQTLGTSTTVGQTTIDFAEELYSHNKYLGKGNVSGTALSESSTFVSEKAQSDLARKLSPPQKPSEPELQHIGFGHWYEEHVGCWLTFILACIGCGIGGALSDSTAWAVVGFIAGAALAGLLSVMFEDFVFKDSREKAQKEFDLKIESFPQQLANWESAYRIWNQVYYCHRDDVVFMPGEQQCVEPNQIIRLCYELIEENPKAPGLSLH